MTLHVKMKVTQRGREGGGNKNYSNDKIFTHTEILKAISLRRVLYLKENMFLKNHKRCHLLNPMEWIIFNYMSEGLFFTPPVIEPECQ